MKCARVVSSLALVGLLAACSTPHQCPPFPIAGPKVAEELDLIPFEGNEDFWFWMGRLEKLKRQLEACR